MISWNKNFLKINIHTSSCLVLLWFFHACWNISRTKIKQTIMILNLLSFNIPPPLSRRNLKSRKKIIGSVFYCFSKPWDHKSKLTWFQNTNILFYLFYPFYSLSYFLSILLYIFLLSVLSYIYVHCTICTFIINLCTLYNMYTFIQKLLTVNQAI